MPYIKTTMITYYFVPEDVNGKDYSLKQTLRLEAEHMRYNPLDFLNYRIPKVKVKSEVISEQEIKELSNDMRTVIY